MRRHTLILVVSIGLCLVGIVGCGNDGDGVTPPPEDNTAPTAITDLAPTGITANSVTLSWTATGDDSSSGRASAYDVRYSSTLIDSAGWFTATSASGEPTPKVAGSAETFTVTGLSSITTYYFAIKAGDEAGNWSAVSNSPDTTTDLPDFLQITSHLEIDFGPAYSPDGSTVAFASRHGTVAGGEDIYVISSTGQGTATRITFWSDATHQYYTQQPTWSPMGDKLAFHSNRQGSYDIWIMDYPGGTPSRLTTENSYDEMHPEWSHDGTMIAFSANYNTANSDIFYISPTAPTGGVAEWVRLTNDGYGNDGPTWSPNDDWVAYHSGRPVGVYNIYKLEVLNPSNIIPVTAFSGAEEFPSWSPDGAYIAYQQNLTSGGSRWDISIVPASGGTEQLISDNDDIFDTFATWSPDSRRVAYTHWGGGQADIISEKVRD